MEKQTKTKNKQILRFLPKVLSFRNPPFSPSRDKDVTATRPGVRFSGPIVSIIPMEARRRTTRSEVADTPQEPTSPRVSCLGQIKQRHQKKKMIVEEKNAKRSRLPLKEKEEEEERMLSGGARSGAAGVAGAKAPALGQMRRFASSGSSLSNFDWTAQVVPEDSDRRNCQFDEERDEEEEEEEVKIPFSAPLAAGGEMRLKPKKEINLWKRRTMAPPRPLTLRPPTDS